MGVGEEAEGPVNESFGLPKVKLKVMGELGSFLVEEGLENGIDFALKLKSWKKPLVTEARRSATGWLLPEPCRRSSLHVCWPMNPFPSGRLALG